MTEAEWLACAEPDKMIAVVADRSARKLRLFALACCERIDHLITDPRSRAALAFAARHVETPINRQKGRTKVEKAGRVAWTEAYNQMFRVPGPETAGCLVRSCAADAAVGAMNADPKLAAGYASSFACFAVAWGPVHAAGKNAMATDLTKQLKAPEFGQQARLLRDIFGNPFRRVKLRPAWLTSDVVALARGIYDERAFDRMPILADALQDAGCDSADVLNHLRDTALAHVRGCWALDLVLGKE